MYVLNEVHVNKNDFHLMTWTFYNFNPSPSSFISSTRVPFILIFSNMTFGFVKINLKMAYFYKVMRYNIITI